MWTITDRKGRKIIEWTFENGERHGVARWWYPNGQMRRELEYQHDAEEGKLSEWLPDGRLDQTMQVGGGQLLPQTAWHSPGHKAAQGARLQLRREVTAVYDWWNGKVSIEPRDDPGPDPQHGVWTFYYPNGQKQMRGEYDHGQPVGQFTWWHPNGFKQAEGVYDNGWREGVWTRWHDNGRRMSQGRFLNNLEVGEWTDWNPDGSVQEPHDTTQEQSIAKLFQSPATLAPAVIQDVKAVDNSSMEPMEELPALDDTFEADAPRHDMDESETAPSPLTVGENPSHPGSKQLPTSATVRRARRQSQP